MRGRNFNCTLEFNGHRTDESVLTCVTAGRTERWSIDIPTVLWLLERIADGDVDPRAVQDELRCATSWRSGCCGECDEAAPHYAEARRRQAEVVQRWTQRQLRENRSDYPYLLNKGKLHRVNCHRPTKPSPPPFPDNLHSFAVLLDGSGGDLDLMFKAFDDGSVRGAEQLRVADVLRMIARDGVAAITAKRCRACKPPLPTIDPSSSLVQPACWNWAASATALDQVTANATDRPSVEANVLPEQRVAYALLKHWHAGRCAVCGETPVRGELVRDHDHSSGLMRGLLCSSCNTAEGRSDSPLFENYRRRPPAVILNAEVLYLPFGFRPGSRHQTLSAM